MSNYRCPIHTDRPVTWRGTGCPDCSDEHQARLARQVERRRCRLERGDSTEAPLIPTETRNAR